MIKLTRELIHKLEYMYTKMDKIEKGKEVYGSIYGDHICDVVISKTTTLYGGGLKISFSSSRGKRNEIFIYHGGEWKYLVQCGEESYISLEEVKEVLKNSGFDFKGVE